MTTQLAVRSSGYSRSVPNGLFAAVPDRELRLVGQRRTYARGEVVFRQGDAGDVLHHVVSGRFASQVVTPSGDVATLAVHNPGQVFGLLAALRPDLRRTANVVALEPAETVVVTAAAFASLRRSYPAVALACEELLVDLLQATSDRLVEALYLPAHQRVRARLRALAELYRTEPDATTATISLSQDHIADLAGTTRETVNRVLHGEVERGSVRLARRQITVDLTRLRR